MSKPTTKVPQILKGAHVDFPKAKKLGRRSNDKAQLSFTEFIHREKAPNPMSHQGFSIWAGALTASPPATLIFDESNTVADTTEPRPLTPPGVLIWGYMLVSFPFPAEWLVLSLVFDGPKDARIDFFDEQGLMFENSPFPAGRLYYPVSIPFEPSSPTKMIGIAHKIETSLCKLGILRHAPYP